MSVESVPSEKAPLAIEVLSSGITVRFPQYALGEGAEFSRNACSSRTMASWVTERLFSTADCFNLEWSASGNVLITSVGMVVKRKHFASHWSTKVTSFYWLWNPFYTTSSRSGFTSCGTGYWGRPRRSKMRSWFLETPRLCNKVAWTSWNLTGRSLGSAAWLSVEPIT